MALQAEDAATLARLHDILTALQQDNVDDPEEYMTELSCDPSFTEALDRVLQDG